MTIRVGHESKDFVIHEDGRKRSPYLMDPRNQESTFISLRYAHPEDFNIYVQWLYTGRLHTKSTLFEHGAEWVRLTRVYLLGLQLGDVDFQDRVIDSMLDWVKDAGNVADRLAVVFDNVAQVYNGTTDSGKDNPLRRLVSDIVTTKLNNPTIQGMTSDQKSREMPTVFLLEVISKLSTRLVANTPLFSKAHLLPELREVCHYHGHKEGECYRKK